MKNRKDVHKMLKHINYIRNRIAHHEIIINKVEFTDKSCDLYDEIVFIARMLIPELEEYIASHSFVQDTIASNYSLVISSNQGM
jgi:hypothetical protein